MYGINSGSNIGNTPVSNISTHCIIPRLIVCVCFRNDIDIFPFALCAPVVGLILVFENSKGVLFQNIDWIYPFWVILRLSDLNDWSIKASKHLVLIETSYSVIVGIGLSTLKRQPYKSDSSISNLDGTKRFSCTAPTMTCVHGFRLMSSVICK